MYRKGSQETKRIAEATISVPKVKEGQAVEEMFDEFGVWASEFVKQISAMDEFTYRGEMRSVEDNVKVTKKVFSKWSVEILISVYSLGSVGFGDLKRLLTGISSRVLSQKLKDLEELRLLERKVIEGRPPSVRYNLSRKGATLAKLGEPVILFLKHQRRPTQD
ncbi:MAG: helix-turn-helix transcriptional regulator [Thaumarchaeota archaeon]|nr:helix-turn-helix transcriptional regulator [Nitrososphaerota archaeon]